MVSAFFSRQKRKKNEERYRELFFALFVVVILLFFAGTGLLTETASHVVSLVAMGICIYALYSSHLGYVRASGASGTAGKTQPQKDAGSRRSSSKRKTA